jgi:hypothetical protein
VHPFASVAVTVNEADPVEVGVPEMTPPELRVNPAGSDPLVIKNAYGALPPLPESV